jgi:hypothetical protein
MGMYQALPQSWEVPENVEVEDSWHYIEESKEMVKEACQWLVSMRELASEERGFLPWCSSSTLLVASSSIPQMKRESGKARHGFVQMIATPGSRQTGTLDQLQGGNSLVCIPNGKKK